MEQRRGNTGIASYLLSACLMLGLCGCGTAAAGNGAQMQPVQAVPEEISYQLLEQAQLDYQVPEQYPGV